MTFQLAFPRTIVFGAGQFARLGELCEGLGNRALLVAGQSALRQSGRLEEATELLDRRSIAVRLLEGVEHDPSLATCRRGIDIAREEGCDLVIAVGGGSVLDAGKTVAAIAPQAGKLSEYFHEGRSPDNMALPFVAVPTTAGTGSECTSNAVLTDTERAVKKSLRDERMVPTIALVDPELTLTVPRHVTAHSGMDALTQAIESYVSLGANPVTDALAVRAIELIVANLRQAVADGGKIEHREPLALGSLITGMAFANAGLGAVHGLASPVGLACHAPHGLVCAVLLPHVCEFNIPGREEKFERIARLLGAASAHKVPAALLALNRDVGIPATLSEFGMDESAFPTILKECRGGSMTKNPRTPTDEELVRILRKVLLGCGCPK